MHDKESYQYNLIRVINLKYLIFNKLKQFTLIITLLLIVIVLISPYIINWYIQKKYDNLIKFIRILIPGVKITSYMQPGYFKSVLMSKIELPENLFRFNSNNHNPINYNNLLPQIITLQHEITYALHKKSLVTINTKGLIGLPKFIKNFNLVTNVSFKGAIKLTANNLNLNYLSPLVMSNPKNFMAEKTSIVINHNHKDLYIKFHFPKLVYKEYDNVVDIDDFKLHINLKNFIQPKQCKITLSTHIEKLYIIAKEIMVLRLANFKMEQKISEKITNNLSFFKLNILDHKYGPLVTKLELNNINFAKVIKHFDYLKFPFNQKKLEQYKLIESLNQLFQYKPTITLDMLLHLGQEKLKFLSDAMLDSTSSEWLSKEDVLNAFTANIFAKIPKNIAMDLITSLVEYQQKKKFNELNQIYTNNEIKQLLSNELENLVLEKIQYLVNNNILIEEDDGFAINLAIAERTFFSKNNPFKIFSF